MIRLNLILLLSILSFQIFAQQNRIFPKEPTGWVNDYADILNSQEENYLNTKLGFYEDSTSTQIFIVTLNDHQGMSIEQLGAEIGEEWGVGQKGKENGLLILVFPNDRQITIQTGYGLEEFVPDAIAKRIIENEITPAFKDGNYVLGLDKGTTVIMDLLSGKFSADQYSKQGSAGNAPIAGLIFIVLLLIIISSTRGGGKSRTLGGNLPFWVALSMLSSSGRGGGSWGGFSGGSGGGGFGGFSGGGGGSFGGGGASGSW
jgi:uncharacterized protein